MTLSLSDHYSNDSQQPPQHCSHHIIGGRGQAQKQSTMGGIIILLHQRLYLILSLHGSHLSSCHKDRTKVGVALADVATASEQRIRMDLDKWECFTMHCVGVIQSLRAAAGKQWWHNYKNSISQITFLTELYSTWGQCTDSMKMLQKTTKNKM